MAATIYDIESGNVAVLTFERPSTRGKGAPQWATVRARITQTSEDDDIRIDAYYESHEGEATQDDLDYALRCIETNSFAT